MWKQRLLPPLYPQRVYQRSVDIESGISPVWQSMLQSSQTAVLRNYIPVEIEQLWVYDSQSGRVIKKAGPETWLGGKIVVNIASQPGMVVSGKAYLLDRTQTAKMESSLRNFEESYAELLSKAKKKAGLLAAEQSCRSAVLLLKEELNDPMADNILRQNYGPGSVTLIQTALNQARN